MVYSRQSVIFSCSVSPFYSFDWNIQKFPLNTLLFILRHWVEKEALKIENELLLFKVRHFCCLKAHKFYLIYIYLKDYLQAVLSKSYCLLFPLQRQKSVLMLDKKKIALFRGRMWDEFIGMKLYELVTVQEKWHHKTFLLKSSLKKRVIFLLILVEFFYPFLDENIKSENS